MLICGVDESGRGPVIGPMVFCAVVIEKDDEDTLKDLGVTDSKMLDAKTRECLFGEIEKVAEEARILAVNAKDITEWMKTASLNDVEAIKTAELLDSLVCEPEEIYVDSPDTVPKRYSQNIRNLCKKRGRIIAEHKADMNHLAVGAASILAKVTRDAAIEELKKEYGEIGNGYPSDQVTQKWLDRWFKKNRSFPECVRKRWSTATSRAQLRLTEW